MQLLILGSNSRGNCYLLDTENECLIIETGVSMHKVKEAIGFNISKIVGCIVTHSHLDHAGKVNDFMKAGINVYMSPKTSEELKYTSLKRPKTIEDKETFYLGGFKIKCFRVKHDVECYGYIIHHDLSGKIVFLTDTFYSPYSFSGVSHFMIEANYCIDILNNNVSSGKIVPFVRDRIVRSHMSIQTAKEALRVTDLSKVQNIVLIHLSDANSNAVDFKKQIEESTGKLVTVADKNMEIDFSINPF